MIPANSQRIPDYTWRNTFWVEVFVGSESEQKLGLKNRIYESEGLLSMFWD